MRRSFGGDFPGVGKIGLNLPPGHHELVKSVGSAELWTYGRVSVARHDVVRDELQAFAPLIARKHFVPFHADMIPSTSFGASLANLLTPGSWKAIRKPFFQSAGYVCQICGESDGPVEGHEVWRFFDGHQDCNGWALQRLETILCLCRSCHQMFHLGLGAISGQSNEIGERVRDVNEWTAREYQAYVDAVSRQHVKRSRRRWTLDLSSLGGQAALELKITWTEASASTLRAMTKSGKTDTRLVGATYKINGTTHFEASPL
jgi:ribosomal protein L28